LPDTGFKLRNEAKRITADLFCYQGYSGFDFPYRHLIYLESVVAATGAEAEWRTNFVVMCPVVTGTIQLCNSHRCRRIPGFIPAARCYREAEDQDAEYEPEVLHCTNVGYLFGKDKNSVGK
jgi:hypothetical protein